MGVLFILKKLIIGNTKGFIRGKALSVEGHTHTEYASTTHKHDASDINSGVLSVEHGGTGSASLDDFLNKLNTVKVHSGTYVGNDKYGSSNRNSIVLPFAAKFVLIYSPNGGALLFVYNAPYGINIIETNRNMSAYWEINKLSWYNDYSANVQMNVSGVTYGYYIFG